MAKASKSSASTTSRWKGSRGTTPSSGAHRRLGDAIRQDADLTPLFAGLPDDRCQCEHWGYVFEGKLVFHTADGDEEFVGGDAYSVGPGHTPSIFAGTSLVEFSPTERLNQTMEVVTRNMEAAQGG